MHNAQWRFWTTYSTFIEISRTPVHLALASPVYSNLDLPFSFHRATGISKADASRPKRPYHAYSAKLMVPKTMNGMTV